MAIPSFFNWVFSGKMYILVDPLRRNVILLSVVERKVYCSKKTITNTLRTVVENSGSYFLNARGELLRPTKPTTTLVYGRVDGQTTAFRLSKWCLKQYREWEENILSPVLLMRLFPKRSDVVVPE